MPPCLRWQALALLPRVCARVSVSVAVSGRKCRLCWCLAPTGCRYLPASNSCSCSCNMHVAWRLVVDWPLALMLDAHTHSHMRSSMFRRHTDHSNQHELAHRVP